MRTIFLGCRYCGESWSTDLGDYFWMSPNDHFACCDESEGVVLKVMDSQATHITNDEHRIIETTTRKWEVFYKEQPTLADLEHAHTLLQTS